MLKNLFIKNILILKYWANLNIEFKNQSKVQVHKSLIFKSKNEYQELT